MTRVAAALVAPILLAAVLAPWIAPYDPDQIDVLHRFAPPTAAHLLGTDQIGRDLLSRLLHGATIAMAISLSAILLALALGVPLGVLAASVPPAAERPLLVFFDAVSAFPSLVLALAVIAVLGPSDVNLVAVVALTLVPQFARVARAQTLGLRAATFLEAARSIGASPLRQMLRHILPNIAGPLLVLAGMEVPSVITTEAGLSFIGLGVRPPLASWGSLIADGYAYLSESALPLLASSLALAAATLAFTLLGEALRDLADPTAHRRADKRSAIRQAASTGPGHG